MPLKNVPELVSAGIGVHGRKRSVERYQLAELWSLHLYRYHAEVLIDGRRFEIAPGNASVTAPNVPLEYRFNGESPHVFAHFRLGAGGDIVAMPVMQAMGRSFDALIAGMEEAAGWLPTQPRRASVRLWDTLWQLAGHPATAKGAKGKRQHPALARAVREIELHLSERFSIPQVAKRAEISHNHLTRLFRAEFGTTLEGYIRQRRVERALHLLAHTGLPIKTIAAEVGLPDLHFFNKTIRAASGSSPRDYRERCSQV